MKRRSDASQGSEVAANNPFNSKQDPAPIDILSPVERTAIAECFNNNGLHKQNGCWRGPSNGKPISGLTVANLRYNNQKGSCWFGTIDQTRGMVRTEVDRVADQ